MRRFFEEWNKGKAAGMAAIDRAIATNYVFHRGAGEDVHGPKDFKQYMDGLYTSFPDNQMTPDDIIVEGDKAAVRFTFTGTHRGEFMGIPPTNKKVTGSIIEIHRFAGDKLVETWQRFDTLGLMQQFGIMPTPGKGK
jgi:predicted ester cyclase